MDDESIANRDLTAKVFGLTIGNDINLIIQGYPAKGQRMTELIELDEKRRWQYLRHYYQVAGRFYDAGQTILTEEEIEKAIKSYKERPSPQVRKAIDLKNWKFFLDLKEQGLRDQYFSFEHDESRWGSVSIPHSCRHIPEDPVCFGRAGKYITGSHKRKEIWRSEYTSWYKTRLPVEVADGEIAYLSFQSVNLLCDIWINENPVMLDHLGLHPFTMEVTEELKSKESREAVIALKVSNRVSNHPFLFYNGFQFSYHRPPWGTESPDKDWWDEAWSGIADEAQLLILNQRHLSEAFLFTERIAGHEGYCACRLKVQNSSWEPFSGKARVEISKWFPQESSEAVAAANVEVEVLPMNEREVTIPFRVRDPELWSPESPNLYLARIVLENSAGEDLDDLAETFGVRTFEVRGAHFYLNNEKVVPRGTHNAISYLKESEICPTDHSTVKDILLHRKMGATMSRWPSDIKMHYRKIAYLCDQLGLMLTWTGFFEVFTPHPELEMYAHRDIPNMIKSLRNCPSIVIWELGDEPIWKMHHHRRMKWYKQVVDLAHSVDTTRPLDPGGWFSWDMVNRVRDYPDQALSYPERRRRVMKELPIYTHPGIVWDYHYCPETAPDPVCRHRVREARDTLGGERATIFTEYGFSGMPEPTPRLITAYDGKFRWATDAMWGADRGTADIATFGRRLTSDDWRESQAAQAVVLSTLTGYLRECPEEIASFSFMTMFDDWTFYWGLVDVSDEPKLAYHVMRQLLQPVWVSGLHGNTVVTQKDCLAVTVSNFGEDLSGAKLSVTIMDTTGNIVKQQELSDLDIQGCVSVDTVGEIALKDLGTGLHSLEYHLVDGAGRELAKALELCFVE